MSGGDLRSKPWFFTHEAVEDTETDDIDTTKLLPYLLANIDEMTRIESAKLKVYRFMTGYVNSPYLVVYGTDGNNDADPPPQQFVLRKLDEEQKIDEVFMGVRPGMGLLKTLDIMQRLHAHTDVPVPRVYLMCSEEAVIGMPFYVLEFMRGRVFWNGTLSNLDPATDALTAKNRREMYEEFCATMVKVHAVDIHRTGIKAALARYNTRTCRMTPEVMVKHYRHRMVPYVEAHPKVAAFITELTMALGHKQSMDDRTSEQVLVHSDMHFENTIWHPTENRIIALVDWEYCNIGNPFMDLTWTALCWTWDRFVVRYEEEKEKQADLDADRYEIPAAVVARDFEDHLVSDYRLRDTYVKNVQKYRADGGRINVNAEEVFFNDWNFHFYQCCQWFRILSICCDFHTSKSVLADIFSIEIVEYICDLGLLALDKQHIEVNVLKAKL